MQLTTDGGLLTNGGTLTVTSHGGMSSRTPRVMQFAATGSATCAGVGTQEPQSSPAGRHPARDMHPKARVFGTWLITFAG